MSKTITTASVTPPSSPLGTDWYADMPPRVRAFLDRRNPQTDADLLGLVGEVAEELVKRLAADRGLLDALAADWTQAAQVHAERGEGDFGRGMEHCARILSSVTAERAAVAK
jgi:hypothetical protein